MLQKLQLYIRINALNVFDCAVFDSMNQDFFGRLLSRDSNENSEECLIVDTYSFNWHLKCSLCCNHQLKETL